MATTRERAMPRTSTRPLSAARRKTLATNQIVSALGALGPDQTAAATAALEVVAERMTWDTDLERSLRQKYSELVELSKPRQPVVVSPAPKPKGTLALGEFNPDAKLDPYQLSRNYEPSQLRTVLASATPTMLREAVDAVQAREPSTKPTSRSKKADMIDYIIEHVAGPGY